jgi:integrase/recombinase XerD
MIQTLSYTEQSKLIRAFLDNRGVGTPQKRFKNLRDYCLCLLGLRCGFRVGECQKLRVSHVWENNKPLSRIHIPVNFNKKNIEGWVVVPPDLQEALIQYVPWRLSTKEPDDDDPILIPSKPLQKSLSPTLSRNGVGDVLNYWTKKAGIPHLKFHTLRHTFATNLLKRGGTDLKVVQMMLRHRSIQSTQVYLHPTQEDCDTAVLKACYPPQEMPS